MLRNVGKMRKVNVMTLDYYGSRFDSIRDWIPAVALYLIHFWAHLIPSVPFYSIPSVALALI